MGWNDHMDFELSEMISDALDEGYIVEGTAAYGIARQVIDQGPESLSERQKAVYEQRVWPALKKLQERRDTARQRELMERDD
jgi:hypothetical protein